MKVYMLKDVERVGLAGEIIKVPEGYARNFLVPRKLAEIVTPAQEAIYAKKAITIKNRKEVVSSKTSMLAEKISQLNLMLKKKMHDDDRLYGSISPTEVVDVLKEAGIVVAKNQIVFDKRITQKGKYDITVKLSASLQPKFSLKIVPEAA
ncbi:50S ribosomal protein L9 [candidate division TM6 bacterium RIFCSPHIGHO2_12_FULL_36_22]|nr:MAG: 50S ribosomal protein L9 [candidate division TM6 bacterium RIFCSPHIGHO2_12_FULL_36_22]